jgi:hypothetical protein
LGARDLFDVGTVRAVLVLFFDFLAVRGLLDPILPGV